MKFSEKYGFSVEKQIQINEIDEVLKEIRKKNHFNIHNALASGYEKIYGYISDSDGIRHSLLDEDNLCYEDVLYMLVTCSAFVNYLISKYEKSLER